MDRSISLPSTTTGSATAAATETRRSALTRLTALVMLLTLTLSAQAAPVKKFKWVDIRGETIYRPTPPDDPNQPYCLRLDDGPWTCFQGADRLAKPPPAPAVLDAQDRQKRSDILLLARYRSLEAIDDGMRERLDHLNFERRAVERNLATQRRALFHQIHLAANRQRASLRVPGHLIAGMEQSRANLRTTQETLTRLKDRAESIRQEHRFMKDRFLELAGRQAAP